MSLLVKTSDFCRSRARPSSVEVKLELCQTVHAFPNVAWVSTETLKRLGVIAGSLGRLVHKQSFVVVKLELLSDRNHSNVEIRSLTAYQIGWIASSDRMATATLHSIPPGSIQKPLTVSLCPVCRAPKTDPVLPRAETVLYAGAILPIVDCSTTHWYYVQDVDDNPDGIFETAGDTFYKILTPVEYPALPALTPTLCELTGSTVRLAPHPDVPVWVDRFRLSGSTVAERIWHVEAKDEEQNLTQCIEVAADLSGRQCVTVIGLAVNAYFNNVPVTTGQWADKLAGLQAALENASQLAPSVLLFLDIDREFSFEDAVRQVEESRFWNTVVEGLHPHTLVVLSTRASLKPGPILENLVFHGIKASLPDKDYIQYLWTEPHDNALDSIPTERLIDLLKGRPYREIVELREDFVIACKNDGNSLQLLEKLCESKDIDRRRQSGLGRIPSVHWEDVGGLAHVRREIMDAIELPLYHPELFASTRGRSGILLYGPPGTGKTLVAKAVATECALPFCSVKGPELLGSYVGESEAHVRSTFEQARVLAKRNQPQACILFFDELDSLAPRRGDQASGANVMDRVVATLFAELDRESHDGSFVFCIGATNRPDLLDPALLRPGRLDRLVYLGTPGSDRAAILAAQMRNLRLEGDAIELAAKLVPHLSGYLTGADLSAIVSGALLRATERLCEVADEEVARQKESIAAITIDDVLSAWTREKLEPIVTFQDLLEASREVVPSVTQEDLRKYEQLREKFSATNT